MKNLNPLLRNKYYYDKIVAAKTTPAILARLQAIAPQVHSNYNTYTLRARNNNLQLFNATVFAGADIGYLNGCYSEVAEVIELKAKIRNAQDVHLRNMCMYCMVGTSDTFDHYIPKTPFPEFSVLSNNLIPACDHCNRKKWMNWKNATNERRFISFYYDQIPVQQFLVCTVTISPVGAVATFTLQNPGINANVFNLIDRHFNALKVLKRIHSFCPGQIYNIGRQLLPFVGHRTRAQVSAFLIQQSNLEKADFGNNYCWAILKEELANSVPYLTSLGL